jgi:transcriptional regulator with XRE-family HTH domain
MAIDLIKRKAFGRTLKIILIKYDIRQNDLAKLLKVGRSYINQICSGMTVFDGEKSSIVYDFFIARGVSEQDLHEYSRLYVEARSNFNLRKIGLETYKQSALKSIIIDDMEYFSEESLKKFRQYQEKLLAAQRSSPN